MKDLTPMLKGVKPDLDRYLDVITYKAGDPTYSVLRAHLMFEELLREFISKKFPHPEALEGARLTFAQVLALAKASATTMKPTDFGWQAIAELNRIRNLLAHDINSKTLSERVQKLTQSIVRESGVPWPEPTALASSLSESRQPMYTALDMALIGLFSEMAVRLGVDAHLRLIIESKRGVELVKEQGGSAR